MSSHASGRALPHTDPERGQNGTALLTRPTQLLEPFQAGEKPRERWRVGAELEKFAVFRASHRPLQFGGPTGVQGIFEHLVQERDWTPVREVPGGPAIALERGRSAITLEPAAQFELSSAPQPDVHALYRELRDHYDELCAIAEELGLEWISLGFHPLARQQDLPWVPKLRYPVMREYLKTRGARAWDMMRRTATVQAHVDFDSPADALRKLRVALKLSPVVTALFANSPFVEGRANGLLCNRADVWLDMDPDRTGLLPFMWDQTDSYDAYIEWALDAPMFLLKRGERVVRNTGQTFRAFMKDGFEGERASTVDWSTHLSTLFPEVRLKNTIELRGADSQHPTSACAVPALWKGVFYDEAAMSAAEALTASWRYEQVQQVRPDVVKHALKAQLYGRPILEWAQDVVGIAVDGLKRQACQDDAGRSEEVYLQPFVDLLHDGETPADVLLRRVPPGPDFADRLLRAVAVPCGG